MYSTQLRQPIVASLKSGAMAALTQQRSLLLLLAPPSLPLPTSSPPFLSALSSLLPLLPLFACFHVGLTISFDS